MGRFRDLPLFLKGLSVIAIPLAGLLAIVIAFYFVQRANQEAERSVTHALEVRSQIQVVQTRLEEAETGTLGYLLTRDSEWLKPYEEAQKGLPRVIAQLESMLSDSPPQLGRVQMIKSLIAQQLARADSLPERVPAGVGLHPALVESKERLDTIRRLLDETRDAENRLVDQRRRHAQTVWMRGYATIAAGMLFAPLGAVAATLLFTKGVARRIEVLEENAHRLAEGKPITSMPSERDEIGRLESSLSEAAALLARRESELRHSRDELEQRVEERTSELEEANRALAGEVAERKNAEDEVADANRRLQAIIDASPLAIIRLDAEGNVVNWNSAAERILGWTEQERAGLPFPSQEGQADSLHDLLAGAARGDVLVGLETHTLRKDGRPVELRLWTAPLVGASGAIRGSVLIAADFTEQRQLEEQLAQAQKMEAIGRLAGGVAHDFNNVITIVSGYGYMLLEGNKENPELREAAEEVLKAADRAAALASQLLSFSRRQVIQPRPLDLNGVVRNIQKMLVRVIGEDIELVTLLRPDVGAIKADSGQLDQVLLNLVLNARDAMPGGGKLTIETANATLDETYGRTHAGVVPGEYAMLAVSDTGSGMDAETRAHIFEPFFTTKDRGKGTGLGLSTVYGIVKQHGGDIWVYSEPGRGSTFKIYLPRIAGAEAGADGCGAESAATSGTETVLVVEDEDSVRKLVREILEQRGYRVLEAGSGAAALEVGENCGDPIDLLVTDVVMPKMNGRDLSEALSMLRPQMKTLYLSGYTGEGVFERGLLDRSAEFLQKPFTPETLVRKVRDVLDGRSRTA
ncbi:MAG: ATP-binding protein [Acidobacteriota bacterium]